MWVSFTVNGRVCYLESLHHTIPSSQPRTNDVTMALSLAEFQKCGGAGDMCEEPMVPPDAIVMHPSIK